MRAMTASRLLSFQYGLLPTMPGWMALTRIGASSVASVRVRATTPPFTVETVVEPGVRPILGQAAEQGRWRISPLIRSSSVWTTSV